MWPIFAVAGAALAYYLVTKPAPAEGRSWRLVPGVSQIDWPRVYPDALSRLAAARAVVLVQLESKDPSADERVPVRVRVATTSGGRLHGHFQRTADEPIPSPWGPRDGTPVSFGLADVWTVVED